MVTKPVQSTDNSIVKRDPADPFLVVLDKHGANWHEEIQPGRDATEMRSRLNSFTTILDNGVPTRMTRDEAYHTKWDGRKRAGRKDKPRYHGSDHLPIIMTEGESIRFEASVPFLVTIMPEPEIDQTGITNPFVNVPDADVPFAEFSKQDVNTTRYFVQRVVKAGDDVVTQLFWKMIFVVMDDGTPQLVDPDFYCDR
jgi:hypothetical protein